VDLGRTKGEQKTRVFHAPGKRAAAMDFARAHAGVLGPVRPVEGDTGGAYDVLVVVGRERASESQVRVSVVDGHCRAPGCKNPLVGSLVEALAGERYAVSEGARPKNARATSELWYAPGAEADAQELLAGPLKPFVIAAPKRWEWGGDFDVLVIAGPPP
jgi:hypothetical protein